MKHARQFLLMAAVLLCSFGVNAQNSGDITTLFANTDFEDGTTTGWTTSKPSSASSFGPNNSAAEKGYQGTYFMEAWRRAAATSIRLGDFEWSQTQTVPNGTYLVSALAHAKHEADASLAPQGIYIFAEDQQVEVTTITPSEYVLSVEVTDGTLTIGYRGVGGNVNWVACDDFRVISYDPNAEYTVTFCDEDGTVLETEKVKGGQQLTYPAAPSREGYYFAGWSKSVSKVYSDLEVHAIYRELGTPITGLSQLNDSYLCHLSYYNGFSLAVDIKGDALKANGQLGFANSQEDGRQLFAFITPDGGATYYLYHPAEMKYINKDGSLGDTPTDPIYIIPGKYENTFHLYFDDSHHIRIYYYSEYYDPGSVQIIGSGTLDDLNSCTITPVCKRSESAYSVAFLDWDGTLLHHEFVEKGQSATPPADPVREGAEFLGWDKDYKNVQSRLVIKAYYKIGSDDTVIADIEQLSNDAVCLVSQPHHGKGTTSWAIAQGGNALKSNVELGLPVDIENPCQQFAFISNDEGQTHYLYHPAERKYVNKDGSLSATPQDVIKFKGGQYANSSVVYFDDSHYINVNGEQKIVINSYKTPDGGNSCTIAPLGGIKVTVFNDKDDPNKKYTVRFCDMDGTVLKNDAVPRGQSATPPATPQRDGFTFMAWSKEFSNVQAGTIVYAIYTHNETGHITSLDLLDNEQLWFVSQRARPTSWAIDKGGAMLKTNALLNLESNKRDLRQLFSFVSYDGGQTHYLYHPAEKKYVNIDGSLGDTPVDPIHFERITLTNGYVYFAVYFDETHYIKVTTSNAKPDRIEITKTLDSGAYNLFVPVDEAELDAEYTVTFYDWNDAVLKTEQVKNGQSATAPTSPQREGYAFIGWDTDFRYVYSDLSVKALYGNINAVLPAAAPRAELWYDFMGVGEKGFVKDRYSYYSYFDVAFTAGISQQFKTIKSYSGSDELSWSATCYIEDLNRDGVVDISTAGANSLLSQGGEFEHNKGMLIVPNFDINNDGRLDYLKSKGNNSWSIMVHQADGSFVEQFMHVMTEEEYESTFDPENWQSTTTQKSAFTGLVAVGGWSSSVRFSGYSNPDKAVARREANAPQMRAQGMNPTVGAPTRALDLNADGYVDLIDEKNGVLYYNGGEGRWIRNELGGSVMVADLNGDHIQDFIFPGQELWVAVYRGEGDFEVQTLYQNIQVDREMYCYDFDRDGDVDILVTFSAPLNSTGYAYTMFFDNDGTGKFTQLDEQNYGDNNLLFSNCQDLDGDGYYDLLAFRGDLKGRTGQDLVWLKGQPDKTFADPESLVSITDGKDVNSAKISVEDINNDGRMDVWANVDGVPPYSFAGASNAAPTAPAKPEFTYNSGWLTIIWGDGSDDRTATSDLTYALRVGTTPGGDDILRAHANADGTRRNFLDGNMSKFQTYALDLRSRQPATIYVSVQTIDAQHLGSAWSEEASIEHTGAFADFRVSKTELGCGEKLTATALAMPEGFTHTWTAEDGTCTGDGHEVEVVFTAAGEKAITHTLTAADGTSTLYVEMVNVLPNYMDIMNDHIMTDKDYDFFVEDPHNRNVADYNMDGYWDKFHRESSSSMATRAAVVLNGGEGYSYTQAVGIWNTGLQANDWGTHFWYDWDHNGAADLLCSEDAAAQGAIYYLPHNGKNNMKAKQTDGNLEQLFVNSTTNRGYYLHPVDYTHDGNYDMFYKKTEYGNYEAFMYTRQPDGSYQSRSISGDVSNKTWYEVVGEVPNAFAAPEGRSKSRSVDINHDGFIDIAYFDSQERLLVLVNKGNCSFEKLSIPFEMALSSSDFNYGRTRLADMNNDGYYDLVVRRGTDAAIYVMWNEKNQRFAAPEVLPLGELEEFYKYYAPVVIEDLDNNGYLDIITAQQDKSKGDMGHGMYVHYFGAEGVIYQGFVAQGEYFRYFDSFNNNLFKLPNHPWTFAGYDHLGFDNVDTGGSWAPDESYRYCLFPIHGGENERPSAPTDVRAAQTAKGLVIEWNHAQDDATPGVQMRYNLSLKKKDASGEGAYIISPQNACNSSAAPMREYNYINAKQYIVPLSVLPLGEYEIQLQAIDLQGDWSVFTEPLTVTIEDMVAIDGPTSTCTEELVQINYGGTPTDETPVWDFDGCSSYSGSGFGPYSVLWSTPGTKTITLTLGDKVVKHMLYVSESGANMILPSYVFNNMTFDLDLPANMDVEFWVRPYRSSEMEELPWGNNRGMTKHYSDQVKIDGNKLIINNVGSERKWEFKAIVANDNGCDVEIIAKRDIYEKSDLPFISHVTTNAEGQNVIYITNTSSMSRKARVLKETNRRDQYVEIGVSEGGSLTDVSSNASAQAERYVVQPILEDGTVTPFYSSTHQTSHLTINRGLTDNTWNLIWSHYEYEGADIVSYNILRGSSPSDLEEIVSISSRHNSYTDVTPDPGKPYYAIEYVLSNAGASAPSMKRAAARAYNPSGRSNVVNSNMANTIVYANKVSVLSATKKYEMSEENPALALYAEILPAAATSRNVRWEIIGGNDLATITSSGVLMANNPNRGGVVTVQATTIDGTNLTATRQITVAAMGDLAPEPEPETTYTVTFYDWNGAMLKAQTVKQGEAATAPTAPTRTGYTFTGWDKAFTNVQSDLSVTATYTQNSQPVTTYTVKFCDWNGTVLKTQTVQQGQSATAPTAPTREGYTFSGWDKVFTNVQADLFVYAVYTQNSVEPDPGTSELTYTTQFNAGADGWIEGTAWHDQAQKVVGYTSPLYRAQQGKVEKLRITVNHTQGNTKYFCLSELQFFDADGQPITLTASNVASNADHNALNPTETDGGGFAALFDGQTSTYFHSAWKNMPTSDHYLEVTLPNGGYDAFSFKMLSRARTIENGRVYDQSHTFPGVMVMNTAVELVVGNTPEPEPEPEYTVTFYDWNNTVLKTQKVKKGQSATAPANPTREGYTFAGWDKAFTNVQSDLSVRAVYTQNVQPEPEPMPELDNDAVYYVSQPYNGGTSWAIATGGSAMNINTKLGITADGADARQQFAFITNDGGKTHYLYHPAEKKYVNKDNTLSATPRDPVYFLAGEYENTFVVYFDESHVINTNSTDGLIINRWGPLSGWGKADGGNSCSITRVEKTEPDPQPELNNETLYYVSQPYHEKGATSWAIAQGGSGLQTNVELNVTADGADTRQQFAFISNDGGKTHYLYHPAERKYVNMDGSLSATPQDAVYFKVGAYANTFVVYFDEAHFINVNQYRSLVVNDWGPGGRIGVADGGNSCLITPVGKFDISDAINFMTVDGPQRVQKVLEEGTWYIILPDGSKYTMTGVRVK